MSLNKINKYLRKISSKQRESLSTCSCYYWVEVEANTYRIRCSDHFSHNRINIVDIVACDDNTYIINLRNGFFITLGDNEIIEKLKALIILLPRIIAFTDTLLHYRSSLSEKYNKLQKDKEELEEKYNKLNSTYEQAINYKKELVEQFKKTAKELNETL